MSARSNAEVDREIWECLFKADGPMLFFSTDYNAARVAWMRLTEEQKIKALRLVRTEEGIDDNLAAVAIIVSATPRQLCDWILEVVEGSDG